MQTLRNIQGTKDAGNKWFKLLVKIFCKLGIKPNSTCRGIWHWDYDNIKSIIILATDDILFGTTDKKALDRLLMEFARYFSYTTRSGPELSFLNFCLIQSEFGISLDQTTHIRQIILNVYFPSDYGTVPFESSPFPLSSDFEMRLFQDPNLTDDEIKDLNKKHRGGYSTWAGALLHIAEKSRPDLSYVAMQLTGYNANRNAICCKILHQAMCYLYHHPHVPIMYTRHKSEKLEMFVKNGTAE